MKHIPKFDYVFSNPPYQKNIGGTTILNIYPGFMVVGTLISNRSIMIHPARAFNNAGRVVKEDIEKLVSNRNIEVMKFWKNSAEIFPNTEIKGGIMITRYDANIILHKQLNQNHHEIVYKIFEKVLNHNLVPLSSIIHSFNDNKISEKFREQFAQQIISAPNKNNLKTNIFITIPQLFEKENYYEKYIDKNESNILCKEKIYVLGQNRGKRNLLPVASNSYIDVSSIWLNNWKVFYPAASGNGTMGERIPQSVIGTPNTIATQSFITFIVSSEEESINLSRYLKTRFARVLLYTLKTTQQNAKQTWINIPLINLKENNSLINWNVSTLDELDNQLFRMFNLSTEEIDWLMTNIKPMI